jgi:hypothetical protein
VLLLRLLGLIMGGGLEGGYENKWRGSCMEIEEKLVGSEAITTSVASDN